MAEGEGKPDGGPFRGRRGVVVGVAGALLVVGGAGAWAAGVRPFAEERYCWGAWEQDSGPRLLGAREPDRSGSGRTAQEDGGLSAGAPQGTCTLLVTSGVQDSHPPAPDDEDAHSGTIGFEKKVTVTYGAVPKDTDARLKWLGTFVTGSMTPLPDGVPGLVGRDKGMVVLPEGCDVEGRPSVVTISGGETGDGHLGLVRMPTSIGSEWDVAQLLLAVANTGMERVGCAPGAPLRVTSPVEVTEDESRSVNVSRTCRIPGFGFDTAKGTYYEAESGAVNDAVQLCTINDTKHVRHPVFAGQFAMTTQPRLAALFHGLAGDRPVGEGWRGRGRVTDAYGVVEADCGGGTSATYFMQLPDDYLRRAAKPGVEGAFARSVNAVAGRLGCSSVAPKQ